MNKTIASAAITAVLSLLFIFSGISKYLAVENFEITLNYYGIGVITSSILARLIISAEIIAGLLIWIPILRNRIIFFLAGLCLVFCAGLIWFIIKYPDAEDCGCMGKYAQVPPFWALLRNTGLIILLFLLYKLPKIGLSVIPRKANPFIVTGISILVISLTFILYPPEFALTQSTVWLEYPNEFPASEIKEVILPRGEKQDFREPEKYLLAFFSTGCKFCKFSAARLDAMKRTGKTSLPYVYAFWDSKNTSEEERKEKQQFWDENQIDPVPYTLIETQRFLEISGGELPTIFLIKNGKIVGKMGFRELHLKHLKTLEGDGD